MTKNARHFAQIQRILCGQVRGRLEPVAYLSAADILGAIYLREPRCSQQILCLGIGSAYTPAALDQWAFLGDICDHFTQYRGSRPHLTVYDPQFRAADKAFLRRQQAHLPEENYVRTGLESIDCMQCGAYELREPTFVYMPHCPKDMYEALLRANWHMDRLAQLVLCGNELSMYMTDMAAYPCIERIGVCVCVCVSARMKGVTNEHDRRRY